MAIHPIISCILASLVVREVSCPCLVCLCLLILLIDDTCVSLLLPLPQVFNTHSCPIRAESWPVAGVCFVRVCVRVCFSLSGVSGFHFCVSCPGFELPFLPKWPSLFQVLTLSGCRRLWTLSAGPESHLPLWSFTSTFSDLRSVCLGWMFGQPWWSCLATA